MAGYGLRLTHPTKLLRRARKRNLAAGPRQNNPPGKSLKFMSSRLAKNIPLNMSGKSVIYLRASHPMRGAARDRHERAVGCGGREALRTTSAGGADGEAVWSWRPDAGVKFARSKTFRGRRWQESPVTGESAE